MATPLRLLAFHFWEKFINQNLWMYPINWDIAHKTFYTKISTKPEISKFIFWEFLVVFVGVGCSGILLVRQIVTSSPDVSIFNIIIWTISVCGASGASIGSYVLYSERAYTILILKELFDMEVVLKSNHSKARQSNKVDYFGILVNVFVGFGLLVPAILPFLVYLKIDPLVFIFKLTFNEEVYKKIYLVLLLTRMTLETYLVFGAVRSLIFAIVSCGILLKIILVCAAQIMKNSSLRRLVNSKYVIFQSFTNYRGFYIIIAEINNVLANTAILVVMTGILVMTICCLFMIIRMPDVLKIVPIVYISVIGLVFLMIVFVQFQFPDFITLYEVSCGALRSWRLKSCLIRERKLVLRVLKSLRPCSFSAGIGRTKLFVLKRSTLVTFYSIMINYVVTALIADVQVTYQ